MDCVCRKLKKQVYAAVQALEADLMSLNKLSRYVNELVSQFLTASVEERTNVVPVSACLSSRLLIKL